MYARLFIAVLLLCSPLSVHAALNAGVVDGVWFSTETPQAGESVTIYTAVQNQSNTAISGSVAFVVNGSIAGSSSFLVPPYDILAVSIPYTFTGGKFDVSAYITSVTDGPVAYTTVSKKPIVVANGSPEASPTILQNTSPAVNTVAEEALQKSEEVLKTTTPKIERLAQTLEEVRDTLTITDNTKDTPPAKDSTSSSDATPDSSPSIHNTKDSFTTLFGDTKTLLATDGVALWKKAAGTGLTVLAFVVRLWYVWLTLIIAFSFWRLVRGRRIG